MARGWTSPSWRLPSWSCCKLGRPGNKFYLFSDFFCWQDIPSTLIQDEAGNKVWACKDVKENDASSSKKAESSQYRHALHKMNVKGWEFQRRFFKVKPWMHRWKMLQHLWRMSPWWRRPRASLPVDIMSLHVQNICFDIDSLGPLSLLDPGCHQDCPCTGLSQTCRPHLKYDLFTNLWAVMKSTEMFHGLITNSKE